MTNGLRMDSTRQRALFQSFSGDLSSKTAHISNTYKRKRVPDGTYDSATEAKILAVSPEPIIDPDVKRIQKNGLEGSSKNSEAVQCTQKIQTQTTDSIAANQKNHEDSDGEGDIYELLEIDYDDDCPSDDSDVMLIEDTQKAIVIEDDDVDGGQSNCVNSREGNVTTSSSIPSCDGGEIIEQNTIVIEDEDEEDSRLTSLDRNRDEEGDPNSNNSSVIEYERWMTFRSTDNNDDDRISSHDSIEEVNNDRLSVDGKENNEDKEDARMCNGEHNSRGSEADSNSCSVIENHDRTNTGVDIGNEVNTDSQNQISNEPIKNNLNSIVIEDENEVFKVSKSSKTNGHSSKTNEDDKIIIIDDDDDDVDDKDVIGKAGLALGEDESCSYALVDVIDTVETENPKPTKQESVLLWNGRGWRDWRVHISDDNNGTHFVRIHAPAEQNPN